MVAADIADAIWGDPGRLDAVRFTGARLVLPAVFDVTGLAAASTAAAGVAAADLMAIRSGRPVRTVSVDRRAASAAFLSEHLLTPIGWPRPHLWDPIAGDYRSADGWIRLHTNYAAHRAAAEAVLGDPGDRETAAARVAGWRAVDLESAVVEAGGCAAALRDGLGWPGPPEPLLHIGRTPVTAPVGLSDVDRPYAGVRVLDLTRVIAGPVATRTLAAFGADVLRLDPPGFEEVPALVPDVTVGKRCAPLDLRSRAGRATFDDLLTRADVLVCGLRPGALDSLGYDLAALRERRPDLIVASLNAYGWLGPWRQRRGFDSLVQMSCGIAARGAEVAGRETPTPLPAQALDHATGYLLAAAIGAALARRVTHAETSDIRASLLGTANLLMRRPTPDDLTHEPPQWTDADTVAANTAWGPVRRAPLPIHIDGADTTWSDAVPLAHDTPHWW